MINYYLKQIFGLDFIIKQGRGLMFNLGRTGAEAGSLKKNYYKYIFVQVIKLIKFMLGRSQD